jgi:oligoendopeptidase F
MNVGRTLWIASAFAFASAAGIRAQAAPVPDEANPAYTWDLADLYPSPQAWSAAHDKARARAQALDRFAGTLGTSADSMLQALDAISEVRRESQRLSLYALLQSDQNVTVAENLERKQSAQALDTQIATKTAWLQPEILAVGSARVDAFLAQSPALRGKFDFLLHDALRAKDHTLAAETEGVLAQAGEVLAQPEQIFSQLVDGELPYPSVTFADGKPVQMSQAAYEKYRQSANREDRRKAFSAFFSALHALQGTLGATLNTQVLAEEMHAKVRHHANALTDAIFADNMPEAVYRTLVAQANEGLPVLHRYLKMRKAAMGIRDELQYHDLYLPIFQPQEAPHYTVAEMERLSLQVVRDAYGPEYGELLQRGLAGRWMDLFPRPGKANGAYEEVAYDVHPYLLFNNSNDYASLSTFLHEWGHAVHSMLADANQPFDKANYSTFVAETASIGNELLLSDYLIAHAPDKAQKVYLLGEDIEGIRTTFFRQVMFAEFQLAIHEEVEKGGALSGQRMTDIYCGLVKKYYGEAQGVTRIDPAYCTEWAYISHFYRGFYVYQYATSMAGAAILSDAIRKEGAPARKRFLDLLKAGGSDYPYNLYRKAGLDMATPAPYQALVARMNREMDEIEALLAR